MIELLVCLALAALTGAVLRVRNGRFRRPAPAPDHGLPVVGRRATFVQVSAEACAVCPGVARVLAAVAEDRPGVEHVELRAEDHPELLARLDVRRSPTVLLLDGSGRLHSRTSGALTRRQADAALDDLLEAHDEHAA